MPKFSSFFITYLKDSPPAYKTQICQLSTDENSFIRAVESRWEIIAPQWNTERREDKLRKARTVSLHTHHFSQPNTAQSWDRASWPESSPVLYMKGGELLLLQSTIPDWTHHCLFNHLLSEGHQGSFQLGAIMKEAAMNICVQVFV